MDHSINANWHQVALSFVLRTKRLGRCINAGEGGVEGRDNTPYVWHWGPEGEKLRRQWCLREIIQVSCGGGHAAQGQRWQKKCKKGWLAESLCFKQQRVLNWDGKVGNRPHPLLPLGGAEKVVHCCNGFKMIVGESPKMNSEIALWKEKKNDLKDCNLTTVSCIPNELTAGLKDVAAKWTQNLLCSCLTDVAQKGSKLNSSNPAWSATVSCKTSNNFLKWNQKFWSAKLTDCNMSSNSCKWFEMKLQLLRMVPSELIQFDPQLFREAHDIEICNLSSKCGSHLKMTDKGEISNAEWCSEKVPEWTQRLQFDKQLQKIPTTIISQGCIFIRLSQQRQDWDKFCKIKSQMNSPDPQLLKRSLGYKELQKLPTMHWQVSNCCKIGSVMSNNVAKSPKWTQRLQLICSNGCTSPQQCTHKVAIWSAAVTKTPKLL